MSEPLNTSPHKCECNRHPDSAFTTRIVNGLAICPRCGGVVVPVNLQGKGLVELDEDKLSRELFHRAYPFYKYEECSFSSTYRQLAQFICSKFGVAQPSISREDVELVKELKLLKSYFEDSMEIVLHKNDIKWDVIDKAILNHLESRKSV